MRARRNKENYFFKKLAKIKDVQERETERKRDRAEKRQRQRQSEEEQARQKFAE